MTEKQVFQTGELLRFFYNHIDRTDVQAPALVLKRPITEEEVIAIFVEIKKDPSIPPHLVEQRVIDELVAKNYGSPVSVEREVVGHESD